jgi:hypothetical protein
MTYTKEIIWRTIFTILLVVILALLLAICDGCKLPTAIQAHKTKTVDTGWFEIKESEVGHSNPTDFGRMNQWRIIIEEPYWGIEDSIWVDKVEFSFYWKENHPKQNIGFWFAAPVHNMDLKENQNKIKYTFPVEWKASVLSCGVFTKLYGTVRLKAKIFYH